MFMNHCTRASEIGNGQTQKTQILLLPFTHWLLTSRFVLTAEPHYQLCFPFSHWFQLLPSDGRVAGGCAGAVLSGGCGLHRHCSAGWEFA